MPPAAHYILALLAGGSLSLSFAPFNLWPISFVSLFTLQALLSAKPSNSIFLCFIFAIGMFGCGSSWVYFSIKDHGNASTGLALLLVTLFTVGLSLFFILFAYAFKYTNRQYKLNQLLLFPILWVLFEWLRSWLATGFPWLYIGYAHINSPLAAYIPIAGVYGASFTTALTSSACLYAIRYKRYFSGITMACSLLIIGLLLNTIAWTKPAGSPVNIAIVQPNFSLEEKWDRDNFGNIIKQLRQQTHKVANADIIVWPEASIPASYQAVPELVSFLITEANSNNYTLVAGMPYRKTINEQIYNFNSQWVSEKDTNTPQFYFKKHLVPFGEYVPFEDFLRGLIAFFDLPSSHFSAGPQQQTQLSAAGIPVSIYICYEVAYPDLVANGVGSSTILMTVSNDVWFGDSLGPQQHYQIAATRALENGKPMVRSTNNGISGFINHKGKTVKKAEQFTQAEITSSVQAYKGTTPYTKFGSTPIILLCFGLLFIVSRPVKRNKNMPV